MSAGKSKKNPLADLAAIVVFTMADSFLSPRFPISIEEMLKNVPCVRWDNLRGQETLVQTS